MASAPAATPTWAGSWPSSSWSSSRPCSAGEARWPRAAPPQQAPSSRPRTDKGGGSMNNKPMNRLALTALLLLLAAIPARAGEEMVTFKSGSEDASGLLVAPAGKGPFPAVLVIQEWWGLNDWVKDQARALAREGYLALAVDLYRGKVATKQEDAHQLMMGAPPDRTPRDPKAAHAFLAARPNVKKDRIGAIGWCMGGRWSLALATEIPTLAAVVAYYGAPP